jgi:hypothetical protein
VRCPISLPPIVEGIGVGGSDAESHRPTRNSVPWPNGTGSRPPGRCGCRRMKLGSVSPTLCTPPVPVTTPLGAIRQRDKIWHPDH